MEITDNLTRAASEMRWTQKPVGRAELRTDRIDHSVEERGRRTAGTRGHHKEERPRVVCSFAF